MRELLANAGFVDVEIERKEEAAEIISAWIPGSKAEDVVTSASVTATKPRNDHGARDDVFRTVKPSSAPVEAPTSVAEAEAIKPAA